MVLVDLERVKRFPLLLVYRCTVLFYSMYSALFIIADSVPFLFDVRESNNVCIICDNLTVVLNDNRWLMSHCNVLV